MRNWFLLLLGVTACGRSAASTVDDKRPEAGTVTADERRRMEDSVHAWLMRVFHDWEQGDSAALMATYLPGAGPLVSAGDGELYTSRDSVAAFLTGVSQTTGKHASFEKPLVDVLAPGVAAATYKIQFGGVNPKKEKFERRGVYSVVVVEREGHLHIVQEHQSLAPDEANGAEEAIRAQETRWRRAVERKDTAAIKSFYTEDAIYSPDNNPPIRGRDSISGRWAWEFGLPGFHLERSPMRIEVSPAGDLAQETGTYVVRFMRDQQQHEGGGTYMTAWRKDRGEWRIASYMWNRNERVPR